MFIQIAPKVRVFITDPQIKFFNKYRHRESFRNSDLNIEETTMAKILADKSLFVRKKLDDDVQYAVNRRVRFVDDGDKR